MARFAKVIDKADELGMVVILGIYYFGQDERLKGKAPVLAGVDATIDWVVAKKSSNVLIEINNECNVRYHPAARSGGAELGGAGCAAETRPGAARSPEGTGKETA
jgi:hypothetical protein